MRALIDPSELPLLTDIVAAEDSSAGIPTLTEIVPTRNSTHVATSSGVPGDTAETAAQPHSVSLPPTHTPPTLVRDAQPDTAAIPAAVAPEHHISQAQMQQLIDHFESHLESVFTDKLNRHLQQLHQQAVKLAISELKSELPSLLRKVLNAPDTPQ